MIEGAEETERRRASDSGSSRDVGRQVFTREDHSMTFRLPFGSSSRHGFMVATTVLTIALATALNSPSFSLGQAPPNYPMSRTRTNMHCSSVVTLCVICVPGAPGIACISGLPPTFQEGTCIGPAPASCTDATYDCGGEQLCLTGLPTGQPCHNGTIVICS